jgi:hypothetical protein
MRQLSNPKIVDLVDEAGSDDELIVAWKPGSTQPVGFTFIAVNGELLIHDRVQPDSPVVIRRLPPPDGNGKYAVSWSLIAEVPLNQIAIAVANTVTNNRIAVGGKQNLARGDTWRDEATVDAP